MSPISTKSDIGTWAQVNRNNPAEKSVIDYILAKENDEALVTENVTDEIGSMRLKGIKESDHNSLMINIDCPVEKSTRVIKIWKLSHKEG